MYSGNETVEVIVEAVNDLAPSDRRRFALLNIPKHLFSSALGEAGAAEGNARIAASIVVDQWSPRDCAWCT